MVTKLMIRGPQIIPRHDNRHDAQIFGSSPVWTLSSVRHTRPVIGITSLQAPRYRHYSRTISHLFAELVALFSLVTTGQLEEEEESALGRKAAGAAFGWRRYCKGLKRTPFSVVKDADIGDLDEGLRISWV
jgi:hypothetical protein